MFWRANPPPGSCFQRHRCCVCDTRATSPVMALGDPPEGLQKAAGQHQVLFLCQSHPDPWKPWIARVSFPRFNQCNPVLQKSMPSPCGPALLLPPWRVPARLHSSFQAPPAGHGKSYQALSVDNRGSGTLRTSAPHPRAVSTSICFVLSVGIFEGAGKCALFLGISASLGELGEG